MKVSEALLRDDVALDLEAPAHHIQVQVRKDGRVLWVNVDGKCMLRICQIRVGTSIIIEDNRKESAIDPA